VIRGIGSDVVSLERIQLTVNRYGDTFTRRFLSEIEFRVLSALVGKRHVEYLAGRFAAREALAKAVGCGLARINCRQVIILGNSQPIHWTSANERPAEVAENDRCLVSISHSENIAFAVAIWETLGQAESCT